MEASPPGVAVAALSVAEHDRILPDKLKRQRAAGVPMRFEHSHTIVNLVRYARDTDWSSVWSQVLAWLAGIVATLVVAHTALANAFSFGTKDLAQIGFGSQVLVGLAAASTISIVYQFKKAVDSGKNAVVPSLLPNARGKQASAEAAMRAATPPS